VLRNVTITPFNAAVDAAVVREFPTLSVNRTAEKSADVRIVVSEWRRDDFALRGFDAEIESASSLAIAEEDLSRPASIEILTRAQRMIGRRNQYSANHGFDDVLQRHFDLHDLDEASERDEYNHALDSWQWMLRLAGAATLTLQIAALFHDAERLISPAMPDSPLLRDAQARAAAEITRRALAGSLVGEGTVAAAADLVASHQRESISPDVALLNDADSLSFFSWRSAAFFQEHGAREGHAEVRYRLSRMSAAARERLSAMRLSREVLAVISAS
jgi:uncharacterized protein DUF4202